MLREEANIYLRTAFNMLHKEWINLFHNLGCLIFAYTFISRRTKLQIFSIKEQ